MTIRAILGILFGLLLSVAGVALVAWLLWWLWTRHETEQEEALIEIEVKAEEAPEAAAEEEAAEAEEATVEEAPEAAVEEEAAEAEETMAEEAEAAAEEGAAEETKAPEAADVEPEGKKLSPPDDLKVIEGIGPKISGVLQAAGVTTYAQLAETDPERISQILEEADPRLRRLANPATWPEQAALAAAGRWAELEKLQSVLKGGRRV